jgi:hypothetical protein
MAVVHNCDGEVYWVPETPSNSAASEYESGATGWVDGAAAALQYYKPGGASLSTVEFDGYDAANGEMIDRKLNVTNFNKSWQQAINQCSPLSRTATLDCGKCQHKLPRTKPIRCSAV